MHRRHRAYRDVMQQITTTPRESPSGQRQSKGPAAPVLHVAEQNRTPPIYRGSSFRMKGEINFSLDSAKKREWRELEFQRSVCLSPAPLFVAALLGRARGSSVSPSASLSSPAVLFLHSFYPYQRY